VILLQDQVRSSVEVSGTHVNPITLLGLFGVSAIVVCYALENRSRWFTVPGLAHRDEDLTLRRFYAYVRAWIEHDDFRDLRFVAAYFVDCSLIVTTIKKINWTHYIVDPTLPSSEHPIPGP